MKITEREAILTLLAINHLSIAFDGKTVVHDVSLTLNRGETLALVGESGSGKSVTALSVLRLLPAAAGYPAGAIRVDGREVLDADAPTLRDLRGGTVGMIFQEPMSALNPLHSIGRQIAETLIVHQGMSRAQARRRTVELLEQVELGTLAGRLDAFPHQLSGGQRQRVMIAMALANDPALLIADEPTTALDVTVQAEILRLLQQLQAERGMAMLFISHDLGVVRHIAQRVAVMKDGRLVETGVTSEIFRAPQHAYTQALLAAAPGKDPAPLPETPGEPVMRGEAVSVAFPAKKNFWGRVTAVTQAVDHVSLEVRQGETLGIVGESGSGKTTLALALLRLLKEAEGGVRFHERRIDGLRGAALRRLRKEMQIVFQDPYASLNPRMNVEQIIGEGLRIHGVPGGGSMEAAIGGVLEEVGLQPEHRQRYPHEFSGGQRQRINIARAVALRPKLIVFDEPTSALDLVTQAQIIALLKALQTRYGLAYLFISHDLRVVRAISHRLLVLKDGKTVESGPAAAIFARPQEAYTRRLLAAAMLSGEAY